MQVKLSVLTCPPCTCQADHQIVSVLYVMIYLDLFHSQGAEHQLVAFLRLNDGDHSWLTDSSHQSRGNTNMRRLLVKKKPPYYVCYSLICLLDRNSPAETPRVLRAASSVTEVEMTLLATLAMILPQTWAGSYVHK